MQAGGGNLGGVSLNHLYYSNQVWSRRYRAVKKKDENQQPSIGSEQRGYLPAQATAGALSGRGKITRETHTPARTHFAGTYVTYGKS
jgi:hypothetical protein